MNDIPWKLISAYHFDELMAALDRAERKGYLADAIADDWAKFDYRDATPPAADSTPVAGVPEGWKLVPVEPVSGMVSAGGLLERGERLYSGSTDKTERVEVIGFGKACEIWRAMLESAPAAPASAQPPVALTDRQLDEIYLIAQDLRPLSEFREEVRDALTRHDSASDIQPSEFLTDTEIMDIWDEFAFQDPVDAIVPFSRLILSTKTSALTAEQRRSLSRHAIEMDSSGWKDDAAALRALLAKQPPVAVLTGDLKRVIDLLDISLGDSDPMIDDDMSQEEIEAEYPVMCAMQILVNLLSTGEAQSK